MVAVKNIVIFVASVSALALKKRDTATILADIATIDSDTQSLTSAVEAYNGGILAAIPVASDFSTLQSAVDQGTTDAEASTQASSADSESVIAAINALIPDIQTSLNATVAKAADFAADGLTALVESDLESLQNSTDAFANALIAIASSDTVDEATAQKASIDALFATAIAAFAS